jgi:hypothetical protein
MRARAHPARSRSIGKKLGASPAPLVAHLCPTRPSAPIPVKHCATPAHSQMCGKKLLPARRSSSGSSMAIARSTTRRSRSCGRCSCKPGGHAARMAVSPRVGGRSARSFPNSTILLGLSSARSIMQPSRLFRSRSGRRCWRAFHELSPTPQSSTLFGMTRSYEGEEHSSACARQPVSKLEQRGKATKRENIEARYSHISWLFRFGFGYSQAKMAPDTGHPRQDIAKPPKLSGAVPAMFVVFRMVTAWKLATSASMTPSLTIS